jgi:hypothetical protein
MSQGGRGSTGILNGVVREWNSIEAEWQAMSSPATQPRQKGEENFMQIQQAIMKRTIMALIAALIITGAMLRADAAAAPVAKNCNPVSFLESVWPDLLGRAITPGEKASLLNFLGSGATHTQVAQFVLNTVEYRTKLAQSLYQQFLGRAAVQTEINFLLSALQQGATVEQLIAVIVSSTEYYQNRGDGTNNGFLEQLYSDLLDRPIDEGSLVLFTDLLSRGGTRLQVALFILGSSEYRSNQIQSFFKTFLQREASDSEIKFFLAFWQQGVRREQLIAQIIGSPEYCELARRMPHGHRP